MCDGVLESFRYSVHAFPQFQARVHALLDRRHFLRTLETSDHCGQRPLTMSASVFPVELTPPRPRRPRPATEGLA
jgi:hypothetical protein